MQKDSDTTSCGGTGSALGAPAQGSSSFMVDPNQGVFVGPPMATRREFAAAAAATAVMATLRTPVSRAAADAADTQDPDADPADPDATPSDGVTEPEEPQTSTEPEEVSNLVTVDEQGNVHIINTYDDLIEETDFTPEATYMLPIGSNVYVDCSVRAAYVQANPGGRPFTVVGCLDFTTGQHGTVLANPVGGSSFAPAEARATEQLLVWLEVDNATDDWALYAVPFNGQTVSVNSPGLVKLAEGDRDWLPAQFAVEGNSVVWQVMPDPYGPFMQQNSHAYRWMLGSNQGTEVYSSPGRFACAPSISNGVLTIAPRVYPDEGVYYGITAIDLNSMQMVDQHVMPVAVKPFFATRIHNQFAFSVEANYGYGGLMGQMGYYIGPGDGPFEYVAREPSAHVTYTNGYYIVKSQLSYFVIDMARKTYARIAAASGCVDYGDYPATSGTSARFVTYAAVKDSSTGIPDGVLVRIFSLT